MNKIFDAIVVIVGVLVLLAWGANTIHDWTLTDEDKMQLRLAKIDGHLYCETETPQFFTFGDPMPRWQNLNCISIDSCVDDYYRRQSNGQPDRETENVERCNKTSTEFCLAKKSKYWFGMGEKTEQWQEWEEYKSSSDCLGDTFTRCLMRIGTIADDDSISRDLMEVGVGLAVAAVVAKKGKPTAKTASRRASNFAKTNPITRKTYKKFSRKNRREINKLGELSKKYKKNPKYFSSMPENQRRLGAVEGYFIRKSKKARINGKVSFLRNDLFTHNKENYKRMLNGKAPLGYDGKPVELHHLKQRKDGELLELLKTEEHSKYYKALHRYKDGKSDVHRGANQRAWDKERKAYWKSRAKTIEDDLSWFEKLWV